MQLHLSPVIALHEDSPSHQRFTIHSFVSRDWSIKDTKGLRIGGVLGCRCLGVQLIPGPVLLPSCLLVVELGPSL